MFVNKRFNNVVVSVVIPNWNGKHLLEICLPSLKKQSFKDFEVIIVDNGSKDDSISFIESNFPNYKVISLPKNIGFAGAVNAGIKASKGKYVVLLNNDTEVDKNCLKFLVQAALKHPEAGMVAAKILNFYQRDLIDNTGDSVDSIGHSFTRGTGEKDGPKFNKAGYIFLVTGGGGLFKKELFNKVGLLDDSYFLYMEDVDLGFRAQLAGFKGWFEPRAKIYHVRMASSSKNMSLTECFCFRNMTMNIIKDYPRALILNNFNWLKIILVNINTFYYLTKRGYLWGALNAQWYVITHLGELLNKRKQIQQSKVVSDGYIIENVIPKKITFFGLLKDGF